MSLSLQTDAHGSRRGERSERDAEHGDGGQKIERRREIVAGNGALGGAGAEDQHRDRNRQRENRQQHAAPPDTERERCADGAQQAERDASESDRSENAGDRGGRDTEREGCERGNGRRFGHNGRQPVPR